MNLLFWSCYESWRMSCLTEESVVSTHFWQCCFMPMNPKSPLLFSIRAISPHNSQRQRLKRAILEHSLLKGRLDPGFVGAMAQNNSFLVTLANMLEDFRCRICHCYLACLPVVCSPVSFPPVQHRTGCSSEEWVRRDGITLITLMAVDSK